MCVIASRSIYNYLHNTTNAIFKNIISIIIIININVL